MRRRHCSVETTRRIRPRRPQNGLVAIAPSCRRAVRSNTGGPPGSARWAPARRKPARRVARTATAMDTTQGMPVGVGARRGRGRRRRPGRGRREDPRSNFGRLDLEEVFDDGRLIRIAAFHPDSSIPRPQIGDGRHGVCDIRCWVLIEEVRLRHSLRRNADHIEHDVLHGDRIMRLDARANMSLTRHSRSQRGCRGPRPQTPGFRKSSSWSLGSGA
jgi:hypothetical protein